MTTTVQVDRRSTTPARDTSGRAETLLARLHALLDRETAGGASHVPIATVQAVLDGARR